MKQFRSFLAAVLTLSLVAGFGGFTMKQTVSAAANQTIRVKADDFILTLPAEWKNNYVRQSSKGKKNGSYVAFSAKKCQRETGDGFLFSIWRYKYGCSYRDLQAYELVGKWNGYNYVAMFPTDIQTMGASKAAKKQYRELNGASYGATFTIRPVKRTGKNVYRAGDFSLKLPASWKGNYTVKKSGRDEKNSFVSFYAKECHEETGEGFLFSISKYTDKSYKELPAYEVVGIWNEVSYVAEFPTDVQFAGASEKAVKQYQKLDKYVQKVVKSIAG